MKKLLLLSLLCACATSPPSTLSYPPAVRTPPYAPPGTGAPPIGQPGQVGRPAGPKLTRNRRTLPATPEQQAREGIWASDQPGALAVVTTACPPGVSKEAWADCEQRVREVTFDHATLGWEERELFARFTSKDAACLWERLMRQCVADRGTASSVERFEAAMGPRVTSACQGVDNRRNSPINVIFRGVHFWGQTSEWTSATRRNREAGLRTEPIEVPPLRTVPPSERTVYIPPPPAPVQRPPARAEPAVLRDVIGERMTAAPASTTREAWAKCWQDVVGLLTGEPEVLLLTPVELRCLRTRLLSECGSILLDAAKEHRRAGTGTDFLDRFFPARQWDSEGWANQRDNVERKRCQDTGGLIPFVRHLNQRLSDRAEAGPWKYD